MKTPDALSARLGRMELMSRKSTTAAFFDLDHTLLARSSGELYVRAMKEKGLLNFLDLSRIVALTFLYRMNLLDPERLVSRFATRYRGVLEEEVLGISSVICTRPEVVDGRFTGRIVEPICHGRGKLYWAQQFCAQEGIDLAKSYFYTDSIRDLPTLEAVGHPRPVNPDRPLLREARQRGWPVQRFRKVLGGEASPT